MRLAFGGFDRVSFLPKSRRPAFTLVELLVVIGIIAVLLAILMPVLSRVRESGRRAKCSGNLHSIGQACLAFANDHNGIFPAAYRMIDLPVGVVPPTTAYPYRIPNFIAYPNPNPKSNVAPTTGLDHDMDNNALTGWQANGSTWRMFLQYTAATWKTDSVDPSTNFVNNLNLFTCPSANTPAQWVDYSATYPQYGSVIDTNYMYLGGLSDNANPTASPPTIQNALGHGSMSPQIGVTGGNQSRSHWGALPPATETLGSPVYGLQSTDPNTILAVPLGYARTSSCILAADMVYFQGCKYPAPGTNVYVYHINHPQSDTTRPDFQNVLYADGRVEGLSRDSYSQPLYDNTGIDPTGHGATITPSQFNYSLQFADNAGGFHYWGESSATPQPDLTINTADVYTPYLSGPPLKSLGQPAPPQPNIPSTSIPTIGEGNPVGNAPG